MQARGAASRPLRSCVFATCYCPKARLYPATAEAVEVSLEAVEVGVKSLV
jgi:hypothetical protein